MFKGPWGGNMSHFDATWQPWHSHVPTSHILPTSPALRKHRWPWNMSRNDSPNFEILVTELMKSVYRLSFTTPSSHLLPCRSVGELRGWPEKCLRHLRASIKSPPPQWMNKLHSAGLSWVDRSVTCYTCLKTKWLTSRFHFIIKLALMNNLWHLWKDKERCDGCQVGIHGSVVVTVLESREAEWDMIYDPAGSLRRIVWHPLGLRNQCHSNQLFI